MKKQILTEEERRRRRNEASRRCYLKRKAELEGQKPVAAKNKKIAAKPKTKKTEPKRVRLFSKADPVKMAEKAVKRFAKVAGGLKPMLREAADVLAEAYRTNDEKTVAKVERALCKGLGLTIVFPVDADQAKSKVGIEAYSKSVKAPAFRLAPPRPTPEQPPAVQDETEDDAQEEPVEIPADPETLEKLETGEATKADIDIPSDEKDDEDDEDDDPKNEDDEDDEDDDSPEAAERRRIREERDNEREYEAGRWEMMGEMGEQGAFDD